MPAFWRMMINGLIKVVQLHGLRYRKIRCLKLKPLWKNVSEVNFNRKSQFGAFFLTFIGNIHWNWTIDSQVLPASGSHSESKPSALHHFYENDDYFFSRIGKIVNQWFKFNEFCTNSDFRLWKIVSWLRFSTEIAFLSWTFWSTRGGFWFHTLYIHVEPMLMYKRNAKKLPAGINLIFDFKLQKKVNLKYKKRTCGLFKQRKRKKD